MRGIAAVYVVVYHYLHLKPETGSFWSPNLFTHGYIAVDFFFVMSGFVLSLTHGRAFESGVGRREIRDFLQRRVARIYPLYAFFCVVNLVALLIATRGSLPQLFPVVVVANFAMVQSWLGMMSFEGPMWSISAEWAAYLGFPIFVSLALRTRRAAAWTLGLCVATLFALTVFPAWSDPQGLRDGKPLNLLHEPSALLARCFAEFVIGMVAYRLSRAPLAQRLSSGGPSITVALVLFALLAIRASDVFLVVVFAVFVIALSRDRGPVARALASPTVYALGVWSYAIYLVAPVVQSVLLPSCTALGRDLVPADFVAPLGVVFSLPFLVALAYLAHRYVDLPGRHALLRGITSNDRRGSEPASKVNLRSERQT